MPSSMNVMDAVAVELQAIGWIGMAGKSLTLPTPAQTSSGVGGARNVIDRLKHKTEQYCRL